MQGMLEKRLSMPDALPCRGPVPKHLYARGSLLARRRLRYSRGIEIGLAATVCLVFLVAMIQAQEDRSGKTSFKEQGGEEEKKKAESDDDEEDFAPDHEDTEENLGPFQIRKPKYKLVYDIEEKDPNYFSVLGIKRLSPIRDVRTAFREEARKYRDVLMKCNHPECFGNADVTKEPKVKIDATGKITANITAQTEQLLKQQPCGNVDETGTWPKGTKRACLIGSRKLVCISLAPTAILYDKTQPSPREGCFGGDLSWDTCPHGKFLCDDKLHPAFAPDVEANNVTASDTGETQSPPLAGTQEEAKSEEDPLAAKRKAPLSSPSSSSSPSSPPTTSSWIPTERYLAWTDLRRQRERFKSLTDAYSVLSTPLRKRVYEVSGKRGLDGKHMPQFQDPLREPYKLELAFKTGTFKMDFGFKEGQTKNTGNVHHYIKIPMLAYADAC